MATLCSCKFSVKSKIISHTFLKSREEDGKSLEANAAEKKSLLGRFSSSAVPHCPVPNPFLILMTSWHSSVPHRALGQRGKKKKKNHKQTWKQHAQSWRDKREARPRVREEKAAPGNVHG